VEVDESGAWEPCVFYQRGTLPDGRLVHRSIQVERAPGGACPLLDDDCLFADVNWDGVVNGRDQIDFYQCFGAAFDYAR
jgi:hypothetical protein